MTLDCGHGITGQPHSTDSTTGKTRCYDCCRDHDLSTMAQGEPISLCLDRSLCLVQNLPGTLRITPTAVKHSDGWGFGRRYPVYHIWFIGPDDHVWYGRNAGDNDLLHCRRTKATVAHSMVSVHHD